MEPFIITNQTANTASTIEISITQENNSQVTAQITGPPLNEVFSVDVAVDSLDTYTANALHIQGAYQGSDVLSIEVALTAIPLFSNNYPYTYPF
ncbi:hypothetical protein [Mucilaginibacter sp. CSA2-8R]|uniref:hypothetical protein n=1 Tax=Mucilaginibacter sp. CSA2-8R TaxID=3141542 RepID=UPI00315C7B7E